MLQICNNRLKTLKTQYRMHDVNSYLKCILTSIAEILLFQRYVSVSFRSLQHYPEDNVV